MSLGQALALGVAFVAAALIVGPALRALAAAGLARENYRGARIPLPAGVVIVCAAAIALIPLELLEQLTELNVLRPELPVIALYVVGVAFLGLFDDVLGAEPRGWRGHGAAVLGGGLSTGALKAAGALGLALLALSGEDRSTGEYLLGVGVLVLATNLFNLLDLRPGRSFKCFVVLVAGLMLGTLDLGPLALLGLFAGPVLVVGVYDLRERAMLGDTGSNAVGALAGFWIVEALDPLGQAVALAVMLVLTVYGEFRSISALVDRSPLLRRLDSIGRPQMERARTRGIADQEPVPGD